MDLSIIMPVYNAINTISRSIESFLKLNQLCELNCKLYVIDDFSNDGTFEKIKFYSDDTQVPEIDYDIHVPLGSLGKYLRNDEKDFLQTKNGFYGLG